MAARRWLLDSSNRAIARVADVQAAAVERDALRGAEPGGGADSVRRAGDARIAGGVRLARERRGCAGGDDDLANDVAPLLDDVEVGAIGGNAHRLVELGGGTRAVDRSDR